MNAIPIPGCRHDILGHNLKAIGPLRVLATCADAEHRDPEAEDWCGVQEHCKFRSTRLTQRATDRSMLLNTGLFSCDFKP